MCYILCHLLNRWAFCNIQKQWMTFYALPLRRVAFHSRIQEQLTNKSNPQKSTLTQSPPLSQPSATRPLTCKGLLAASARHAAATTYTRRVATPQLVANFYPSLSP